MNWFNWFFDWLSNVFGYTHPIHPPMTYVPLGMVIGALVFGLWARIVGRSEYALSARHCITLAFIGVLPTVLLGYMDWQHDFGGAWLFAIKMKIILASLLFVVLLAALLLHLKFAPGAMPLLVVYLIAFINIVALGYYGGELVFAAHSTAQTRPSNTSQPAIEQPVTFDKINPILQQNCVMCHSGEDPPHGLSLTSYQAVMAGGDHGKVVEPGQPDQSALVKRIKGLTEPRMPIGKPPLSDHKIALIVHWIENGAPR